MAGSLHEMGSRGLAQMGLVMMALVAMSYGGAVAQSGCASALTGLVPCLSYVTGGNSSTPSSSCCSQLASVVQSSPQCLCSVLNGGGVPSLGITVNQTQALALPSACNVNTPPVARCNEAANGPTASSPISSPADASNETRDGDGSISSSTSHQVSSISGGVGSKVVPSTHDRNTSHGISVMGSGSNHLVVLIVFIIASASTLLQL